MPPDIFVDADACPVKDEVLRVASRHGARVHMVSNRGYNPAGNALVRAVLVPETPDAADDWIAAHIRPGDVAVTADIPLADRCLKAGAFALGPTGRAFTASNIGNALASRNLLAQLRESGDNRGLNATFGRRDRARFLQSLEEMLRLSRRR